MEGATRESVRSSFPPSKLQKTHFERHPSIPFSYPTVVSREFPAIATHGTFAKRRHGFIGRSGLGLAVADLLLTALAAGQTGTDTPFCLGDHGLVHVFLLQSFVLGTLFVTFQFFVGHAHEAIGLDDTGEHLTTELWVALVFEVLVEGAYALAVLGTALGLVGVVSSELDGAGNSQNVL